MGMSIDECFKWLEYHKQGEVGKAVECIDIAIDTMRKYQKIQEIVSDFREYQKGISCGFGGATYMQMVSEVVEDGKID